MPAPFGSAAVATAASALGGVAGYGIGSRLEFLLVPMVFGFGAGSLYLYMIFSAGMEPWWGIDHLRFGIIGMPVSLIAMVVVSLITAPPDAETQAMVDEVRDPTGPTILSENH